MSHNNHPGLFAYMQQRDAPGKSPAMRVYHLEDVVTDFCKFHKLGFIDTSAAVSAYLAQREPVAA